MKVGTRRQLWSVKQGRDEKNGDRGPWGFLRLLVKKINLLLLTKKYP
jgi:hypothetical protein